MTLDNYYIDVNGTYWTVELNFTGSSCGAMWREGKRVIIYPTEFILKGFEMTGVAAEDMIDLIRRVVQIQMRWDRAYETCPVKKRFKELCYELNFDGKHAADFETAEKYQRDIKRIQDFVNTHETQDEEYNLKQIYDVYKNR